MSAHPLDRPVWNALTGPQAQLARGGPAAWRIDPGYGPFAAARDGGQAAQVALAELVRDAGGAEVWLVEVAPAPAPAGTRVARAAPLAQMVAERPAGLRAGDVAERLGEADVLAMAARMPDGASAKPSAKFWAMLPGPKIPQRVFVMINLPSMKF